MAHMIDFSNGRANMAYIGEKPWHGLGFEMVPGMSIEDWILAAGMNYEICAAGVKFENGTMHDFPGKRVLYRNDTFAPLGIVSDGYQIVQPREVMEFFRKRCEAGNMELVTAGCLKGGALYWALAKTGKSLVIGKNDVTEQYELMFSSADGSKATDNRETSIRVVCNNTLTAAYQEKGKKSVKTRHNTKFDAAAVKQKMGIVETVDSWQVFCDNMHALAEKGVTVAQSNEFFTNLLRPAKQGDTETAEQSRAIRGFDALLNSYNNAPGAVPGTAYGLVQGVTHFVDHVRGSDNTDKRLTSAWFGQGDQLKTKAFEMALAL